MKSILHLFTSTLLLIAILSLAFTSCKSDDPPLPDNLITFESTALGVGADDTGLSAKVRLTRASDKDIVVTIAVEGNGVTAGTEFSTTPATANGALQLTIPAGSTEASLVLTKAADVLLSGAETVTFTITAVTAPVLIGDQKTLEVSFSEILSTGATMEINGGGALYPNQVFIDLSANAQTAVLRTSWDLAFYMGDDFHVLINSSTAMMARAIDKNDLNAVTAADTIGFKNQMSINAFNPDALAWIDDPSGDLNNTAFGDISATATGNTVFIINRGNGVGSPAPARGWQKVRVLRNGAAYTLQYADITATTFSEIQIAKDDSYLFKHVQFENGAVDAEPAKDKWDIAWTYFTNSIPNGPSNIPYGFQDLVIQNRYQVQTAKVLTSAIAYDSFNESNIAALTFSMDQLGIGADWRVTSPAPATAYADRYYIVKDAAGNYYKLKFNSILKDGVRGTPAIEYTLVKKAA